MKENGRNETRQGMSGGGEIEGDDKKGLIKKGRLRPVNSDRGNKERSQR